MYCTGEFSCTWHQADQRDAVLAVEGGLAGGSSPTSDLHSEVDQTQLRHQHSLHVDMLPFLPLRPERVCTLCE